MKENLSGTDLLAPNAAPRRVRGFALLLLLLVYPAVSAQDVTIRGRVTGANGEAVYPLRVVLIDTQSKLKTEAAIVQPSTGNYEIRHVGKGNYQLVACSSNTSYLATYMYVKVDANGGPSIVNVKLDDSDSLKKRKLKGFLTDNKRKRYPNYVARVLAYGCQVASITTKADASYETSEALPTPPEKYEVVAKHPITGKEITTTVLLTDRDVDYVLTFDMTPGGKGLLIAQALSGAGGMNVTVKQVPNMVLALRTSSEIAQPGQTLQLPLTITNTGNKEDQFRIQTDLPTEYQPTFSLAQDGSGTDLPIFVTPVLARGASAEIVLRLRVPDTAADGQQTSFRVLAASQADYEMVKIKEGSVNVVATSLAVSSSASESSVMPGDTFTQTIKVRNIGSLPARGTRVDFIFNPNFEFVSASPSPVIYDRASHTAVWELNDLDARDAREIKVTLRAAPDALADTRVLGRGRVLRRGPVFAQLIQPSSNFDSPRITIAKVPQARVEVVSAGLTTTPGDIIFIPFIVRNPGNAADAYELRVTAPGAPQATLYADTNGDGRHQEGEPELTQTPKLDPRGGQLPLLLRVQIPQGAPDRQRFSYNLAARSLLSSSVASESSMELSVAVPRIRVRMEQAAGTPASGESFYYRLVFINEGSGLAKNLTVVETLPDALEFIDSDPPIGPKPTAGADKSFTWRVAELAPGEMAVLRIAVRLRPNLPADATMTTRHTLIYQDANGNNYTGQ